MPEAPSARERGRIEARTGYALYQLYRGGIARDDEMLRHVYPMLRRRVERLLPHVADCDREDIVQDVAIRYWKTVMRGRGPTGSRRAYYAYLRRLIRFQAAASLQRIQTQGCAERRVVLRDACAVDGVAQVDDALFLADLPQTLVSGVVARSRHRVRYNDALRYVAQRIVADQRPIAAWLRERYGVRDAAYFVEHVRVVLRLVLAETWQRLTPTSRRVWAVPGLMCGGRLV